MSAPTPSRLSAQPLVLPDAVVVQAAFELAGVRGEDLLPSGLLPTIPMLCTVLAAHVPDSAWGSFTALQVRLSCRSGVRARALVVGGAGAPPAIQDGWAWPDSAQPVVFERRYDRVHVAVGDCLALEVTDLAPIGVHDVQYVTGLHPTLTGAGDRLAQVELDVDPGRVERGRARLAAFDGAAWGDGRLRPAFPVAATVAVATWTLPRVRFVLDPDAPPHLGTEAA